MRHLITLADLTTPQIERIFQIARQLEDALDQGRRQPLLAGRVMALVFEKPSLRTRVSFEAGMAQLGGSSLALGSEAGLGTRESLADFARVLSQYVDVIVARTKRHDVVTNLARHAACPVINGLTDYAHPCQALADLYTLRGWFGTFGSRPLAWIGDGNNVARSLALGCGKLRLPMVMATPEPYQFDPSFLETLRREVPQLELTVTTDPGEAVRDAIAVYTDVWASMGQEAEAEKRRRAFGPYQVNAELMSRAPRDAVFMHCLPARRGEEVTDEVIDGPQSIVLRQAANRMHLQKGILVWILNGEGP
ncbi:MAG TPA: ornithine carbamoyltransferase [Planctomycetes bacterium]|nr:ornithine carbamoyltransferase [Planctomycetota bacterium]